MQEEKIKEAFDKVKVEIKELKKRIVELEESQSQKSLRQSQAVSGSLRQSQYSPIETRIINNIRRFKKGAVISEINKLLPSTTIQNIKIIIVDERGLCSKASFY
ncbi:hypothetical protein LCGC14_1962520, partial [marine sediment metagenome]